MIYERGSEEMEVKANSKEDLTLFVKKVKFLREWERTFCDTIPTNSLVDIK
jgi:hypothetical protein